jgi:ABC-type transport system substrate-binding protein
VRRALAMAVDKERVASLIGLGYYFPATGGFIPPEMPGHSPGIGLPYDPEAAKALLAEAGYPGGRGFPRLQGLSNSPNKKLAGDTITAHWRETLGIEVDWQDRNWLRLLKRLDREPPPTFLMGWRADYPDPDNMLRVAAHRSWTNWHDPAYADLVERARRVSDPVERLALYRHADGLLVEAAAVVPIVYGRHHLLVKPWIKRLSASAIAWPYWKEVMIEPH